MYIEVRLVPSGWPAGPSAPVPGSFHRKKIKSADTSLLLATMMIHMYWGFGGLFRLGFCGENKRLASLLDRPSDRPTERLTVTVRQTDRQTD